VSKVYSFTSRVLGMFGSIFACFEMWPRSIALLLVAILMQMWANEAYVSRKGEGY
jgi:hypothetical protein